jgi:hypothetical protein
MKCLVTGASSGIGLDMSKYLSKLGHEVIMVSSDSDKLSKASKKVKNSSVFLADFTKQEDVDSLCKFILKEKPDVVINNAGFGCFGFYDEIDTYRELEMINVNVVSVHKITKTCLKYMNGKDRYILNVASSAGLMPGGPLLSTYYATKSYVRSYSLGIYKELKKKGSHVNISVLCPGPVNTNFNNVAGGTFSVKALSSEYVAKYALDKMFNGKVLIVPGFSMKLGLFFSRFLSYKFLLSIMFSIQHKKRK